MNKSKKKNTRGNLCAIPNCKNISKTQPNIAYHLFPKDQLIRKAWLSKCQGMDKFNPLTSRICSNHFGSDDYVRDLHNELLGMPTRKILKPTSVPSLLLPSSLTTNVPRKKLKPTLAKQQRAKKKVINKSIFSSTPRIQKWEMENTILKSTPSANEIDDVSSFKMSVLINKVAPVAVEKVTDWKKKYQNLQVKYAKLEQIATYWKSNYKNLQKNNNMKSKKVIKQKPREAKITNLRLVG